MVIRQSYPGIPSWDPDPVLGLMDQKGKFMLRKGVMLSQNTVVSCYGFQMKILCRQMHVK